MCSISWRSDAITYQCSKVGNEAFAMVCISAEIPVTPLVGSLEERIVLCLIQKGIQVIIVVEAGRYQNSWVTYYLEALCAMFFFFFFIPPCHECMI